MTITKKRIKEIWDKIYFIAWKDDSPRGWIISLLLIFIFIKFIFFPLLSFVTGTTLPLAIVESCSMHHENNLFSNLDSWWEKNYEKYNKFNITKQNFEKFPFKKGFTKGDILFVTGVKPEKIKIGDVIIFNTGRKNPIIHRVINIKQEKDEYIFSTLGDNNNAQLPEEIKISSKQIIGEARIRLLPYAGWVKLIFFEPIQPYYNKGFC